MAGHPADPTLSLSVLPEEGVGDHDPDSGGDPETRPTASTRAITDRLVLAMPAWYAAYDGSVTIRTPRATAIVTKGPADAFPFCPGGFPARHYAGLVASPWGSLDAWIGAYNPGLRPDRISFKRHGSDDTVCYRVRVDDRR